MPPTGRAGEPFAPCACGGGPVEAIETSLRGCCGDLFHDWMDSTRGRACQSGKECKKVQPSGSWQAHDLPPSGRADCDKIVPLIDPLDLAESDRPDRGGGHVLALYPELAGG